MDADTRGRLDALEARVQRLEAAGGSDLKVRVVDTTHRRLQNLERQFSELKALVEEKSR